MHNVILLFITMLFMSINGAHCLQKSFKRFLAAATVSSGLFGPTAIAHAGIDIQQAKSLTDEVAKLKSVQDALDSRDIPFNDLASGVSYREFRSGKGERVVSEGSTIAVEMTLRAKKLATQREPGELCIFPLPRTQQVAK